MLAGRAEPAGRLPVTLPRHSGQIPLYYNHKSNGRAIDEYYGDVEFPNYVDMLDAAVKSPVRLFMYETGPGRAPLRETIEAALPFDSAAVITGPEGGFSEAEAKMAAAAGFTLCSMGERILRCETAPVIAVSSIMYATGNL